MEMFFILLLFALPIGTYFCYCFGFWKLASGIHFGVFGLLLMLFIYLLVTSEVRIYGDNMPVKNVSGAAGVALIGFGLPVLILANFVLALVYRYRVLSPQYMALIVFLLAMGKWGYGYVMEHWIEMAYRFLPGEISLLVFTKTVHLRNVQPDGVVDSQVRYVIDRAINVKNSQDLQFFSKSGIWLKYILAYDSEGENVWTNKVKIIKNFCKNPQGTFLQENILGSLSDFPKDVGEVFLECYQPDKDSTFNTYRAGLFHDYSLVDAVWNKRKDLRRKVFASDGEKQIALFKDLLAKGDSFEDLDDIAVDYFSSINFDRYGKSQKQDVFAEYLLGLYFKESSQQQVLASGPLILASLVGNIQEEKHFDLLTKFDFPQALWRMKNKYHRLDYFNAYLQSYVQPDEIKGIDKSKALTDGHYSALRERILFFVSKGFRVTAEGEQSHGITQKDIDRWL